MSLGLHVAHLTSAHTRADTRIFLKQCRSLARNYRVTLVVADGKGDDVVEGVTVRDVGRETGRLRRMRHATRRERELALRLDAAVYHLHDPELIPVGIALKRAGRCVVFDAHEDLPKQLRSKSYLDPISQRVLPVLFGLYEARACLRFDAVVTATPVIRDKFLRINSRTVDINNFPLLGELDAGPSAFGQRDKVCYVGGITAIRGLGEVVDALPMTTSGARLQVCGTFAERQTEAIIRAKLGWRLVDDHGFQGRAAVRDILTGCAAGIVTFHPSPNHIDAQPNKMFEYMSAGVPVIGSRFPLWQEIIEGNDCGRCVDPLDPAEIAQAIDFFVQNPDEARRMGENGRRAVRERYNWSVEENKLLALYDDLLRREAA